jgi:hypothetical protein
MLCTPPKPSPQRRPAWLRALPLIAQQELAARAGGEHTLAVGVPAAARVALGSDQHVLAERG